MGKMIVLGFLWIVAAAISFLLMKDIYILYINIGLSQLWLVGAFIVGQLEK